MNKTSWLNVFLVFWIILMAGGASALAIPNQEEGDTILPPDFEYGQGAEIAGDLYPPFGEQQGKMHARSSPRSNHSDFGSSKGFDHTPLGSIDMSITSDPDAFVYATFDGVITKVTINHQGETYDGSGGQLIWIYNPATNSEALFAHIQINGQVLKDYQVGDRTIKKGQTIGKIATRQNMRDIKIYDYKLSPHLHYQLWINGKEADYNKILKWNFE